MALIRDDRNVGGVTRGLVDLVESVGRELAALYEQLEALYEGAFVETGERRRWPRVVAAALVVVVIACAVKHRTREAVRPPE